MTYLAEPGAIEYSPISTELRLDDPKAMQKRDLLWKEFDDTPFTTGEESSLGMPSAPKTAADDYAMSNPAP